MKWFFLNVYDLYIQKDLSRIKNFILPARLHSNKESISEGSIREEFKAFHLTQIKQLTGTLDINLKKFKAMNNGFMSLGREVHFINCCLQVELYMLNN